MRRLVPATAMAAAALASIGCGSERREDRVSDKQWTDYERGSPFRNQLEEPKRQTDDRRR